MKVLQRGKALIWPRAQETHNNETELWYLLVSNYIGDYIKKKKPHSAVIKFISSVITHNISA